MAKVIEFEGIDGVGKSTAYDYFIKKLRDRGYKVLATREVGNPHIPVCVDLRKLILNPNTDMSGEAMELVFSAMRIENQKFYKKVEKKYDYIVSDRGWFSHLSYTDHNVSKEFTKTLYDKFLKTITKLPELVIYLEADLSTSFSRRLNRGEEPDAIEIKGEEFQAKVKESFDFYLEQYSQQVSVSKVNANLSIKEVQLQLDKIIYYYHEEFPDVNL